MSYTKYIDVNAVDSHQTSPAYVLTFTRWANRYVFNYKNEKPLNVRKPLVVVNDAISINVQNSKKSPVAGFSCTLKAGDLNYLTAIHPGDFVVVNMVNWKDKAMEIRDRALAGKAINKYDDGFKGLYKITDVRMNLAVGPNGVKEYSFVLQGTGFDEFNNTLYVNPAIKDKENKANPLFFLSGFGEKWKGLIQKKESNNVENLIKAVITHTIGMGNKPTTKGDDPVGQINKYQLPPALGSLINQKGSGGGVLYASDLNKYYLGVWSSPIGAAKKTEGENFNLFFKDKPDYNFYSTGKTLEGSRQLAAQDFQNVKVWSLLQNYLNPLINESYTCYRVAKDNHVYPTLVARQKPFTTQHFKINEGGKTTLTRFLDLPRWKISPELITALSLGRSDSARINFVQVFTRSLAYNPDYDQAQQIKKGNFVFDKKDVLRSGLRPYIASCNYDYPNTDEKDKLKGSVWSQMIGDWLVDGHLKMSGSIQSIGIIDPICVGDNLEFDDVCYHIESTGHTMQISPEGHCSFRTTVTLSMGVDVRSSATVPVYAEMTHTDSYTKRKEDQRKEGVLPGFSDTQDLPGRTKGEEVNETLQKSFTNPISNDKGNKK